MTRNVFDTPISVFVDRKRMVGGKLISPAPRLHYVRTIGDFLLKAPPHYADNIAQVREARAAMKFAHASHKKASLAEWEARYKELKWQSPMAVLQGVCPSATNEGFTSYSNVLCLDIDAPKPGERDNGNGWVRDWEQQKQRIALLPWVAYCALSAGGEGLFVLIPIADHTRHQFYWAALASTFAKCMGLHIDKQTRNEARLRFMSYDPDPHINTEAEVWAIEAAVRRPSTGYTGGGTSDHAERGCRLTAADREHVEAIVGHCMEKHINIAESFDDWMRLAGFFSHYWNDEQGEALFLALSSFYDNFNAQECRWKLKSMDKETDHPANLRTFYDICDAHGVIYPSEWRPARQRGESQRNGNGSTIRLSHSRPAPATAMKAQPTAAPRRANLMSEAERRGLEHNRERIAHGIALTEELAANNPQWGAFAKQFELHYWGDNWSGDEFTLTRAQFDALFDSPPPDECPF